MIKLYHRIMSRIYGVLSDSLEEDYVFSKRGQAVYLKYWTRHMYHKQKAKLHKRKRWEKVKEYFTMEDGA